MKDQVGVLFHQLSCTVEKGRGLKICEQKVGGKDRVGNRHRMSEPTERSRP